MSKSNAHVASSVQDPFKLQISETLDFGENLLESKLTELAVEAMVLSDAKQELTSKYMGSILEADHKVK